MATAATTRTPSSRPGSAGSRHGVPGSRSSPTSTTTGRWPCRARTSGAMSRSRARSGVALLGREAEGLHPGVRVLLELGVGRVGGVEGAEVLAVPHHIGRDAGALGGDPVHLSVPLSRAGLRVAAVRRSGAEGVAKAAVRRRGEERVLASLAAGAVGRAEGVEVY